MTENISLSKSLQIREAMQQDLSGVFGTLFPYNIAPMDKSKRDRVYNQELTALSMITMSVQEDKSLQNSVYIFSEIHRRNLERLSELKEKCASNYKHKAKSQAIQKSKLSPISTNTSAYSQARSRIEIDYISLLFKKSSELSKDMPDTYFNGRKCFLTDGTYLQLQDTAKIREKFNQSIKDKYPRGLLSVIINQGSGLIHDFTLDSDKKSELDLLSAMIANLPENSLLLADDLYNCFAIFYLLIQKNIDIIVPGKRVRKYNVVKRISEGDDIVEIISDEHKSKLKAAWDITAKSIKLRRIAVKEPNYNKEIILYTTILDESINKYEIFHKYFTRWDIEISIREIKSIMYLNIIRAQTPEMVDKELISGLIAYNYIRALIAKAVETTDFSPKDDIFQKYYQVYKKGYVDNLGREYSKHSPGRAGYCQRTFET